MKPWEFLSFLKHLARVYSTGELHLVMDNYATHKHVKVKQRLAPNPWIVVHFTNTPLAPLTALCPAFPSLGRH